VLVVRSESNKLSDCVAPDSVAEPDARRELDRILADPEFHCTERNRKFLRFVAEEYFAGREHQVKAYTIAVDVFGRAVNFDPSTDPIVRIEATRLRAALASYYEIRSEQLPVRIELPKGRYVPVFSRVADLPGEAPSDPVVQPVSAQPWWRAQARRLFPSMASRWVSAGLGLAGGFLIACLLFAPAWTPVISEKPRLTIEMRLSNGPDDHDALDVRDAFMVALSGFQTVRVNAPDAVTSRTAAASVVEPTTVLQRNYRLLLKYDTDGGDDRLWWQVVDAATGEALRSGTERADSWQGEPLHQQLAYQLAVRLASSRGIINMIESARELEHPTLGNGCVLRAIVAADANDEGALAQARDCLEDTLSIRENDADAHAALAGVLLRLDPVEAPTALTDEAFLHADRAVALAPDSDRSYAALMSVQFRLGNVDAAIFAGRKAMSLNPNNPSTMGRLARILFVTGQWDEGVELARNAHRQVVDSSDAETTLAFDAYRRGQYKETLLLLNQMGTPECYCLQVLQVATLAQLGRFDDANAAIAALRISRPQFEYSVRADLGRRKFAPDLVNLLEAGLTKAGLKVA
jgi:tetratricopeptide (TPR) repeat protein